MTKIEHKKNKHKTSPVRINLICGAPGKIFAWEGMFLNSTKYALDPGDADQYDWNKFCGVAFNLADARKNSVMAGWRYIPDTDEFHMCLYYHDTNGQAHYPNRGLDGTVAAIVPDKKFTVTYDVGKKYFEIHQEGAWAWGPGGVNPAFFAREINSWFGGTDPSPKDFVFLKSKMLVAKP